MSTKRSGQRSTKPNPLEPLNEDDWKQVADSAAIAAFTPAVPVPDLAPFFLAGWHVLEPSTPLDPNWHIDAVCDHLQAALEDWMAVQIWRQNRQSAFLTEIVGTEQTQTEEAAHKITDQAPAQRIQNLIINIPPGTAKSRIVSVFMPAWMWLKWPSFRLICLSSNPRVALRDSMFCRDLIESSWYRDTFRPKWGMKSDQNGKSLFWNTAGGFRAAFGFRSRITGDRADAIVWDDPHDAEEVHSEKLRQGVLDKWDGAIGNRVNDLRSSLRIGVMQRLHEADLAGHLLKKGGWEHLCLPMEWDGGGTGCPCDTCMRGYTAIGWSDPRSKLGASPLLFEARFPRNVLDAERVRLGSAGYAGQMQQRPAPADGEIFKEVWWRYWVPKGVSLPDVKIRQADGSHYTAVVEELPDAFDEQAQSWDMTFKDTKGSDLVAGGVWGRVGTKKYLLDQVLKRLSFTKTLAALIELSDKWPDARRKLIEDKANGPAVISALSGKVAGMIAVNPEGGKVARAHAVTPDIEAGDIYLPHPLLYTIPAYAEYAWVKDYIGQHTRFPYAKNDDQVDQTTQMLKRWITSRDQVASVEPVANRVPMLGDTGVGSAPVPTGVDADGLLIVAPQRGVGRSTMGGGGMGGVMGGRSGGGGYRGLGGGRR